MDKLALDKLAEPRMRKVNSSPSLVAKSPNSTTPQRSMTKTNPNKLSPRTKALYNDYEIRQARQRLAVEKALAIEEEVVQTLQRKFAGRKADPIATSRLCGEIAEKKRQEKEIRQEEASKITEQEELLSMMSVTKTVKSAPDPDTFNRLYLDGLRRKEAEAAKHELLMLTQERYLKASSIHRRAVGDARVFDRLSSNPTHKLQLSPRRCEF